MKNNVKVSVSILTADLSAMGEQVELAREAGADLLHVDVMDGIFVPPMTFGDVVLKSLTKRLKKNHGTPMTVDSHLMVTEPERLIPGFIEAGSDIISFHIESNCDVLRALQTIKSSGIKAGIAVNPPTSIETVFPYLGIADMFIVMSVNPGYGGQSFIPETLNKIKALRQEANKRGVEVLIEVDGGINNNTAPEVVKAGADILVAGAFLFNADNMGEAVRQLTSLR